MFTPYGWLELRVRWWSVFKKIGIAIIIFPVVLSACFRVPLRTGLISAAAITISITIFLVYRVHARKRGSNAVTAKHDGVVVGFLDYIDCFVAGCFVEPHWQKQGIGKALIQHWRKKNYVQFNILYKFNLP